MAATPLARSDAPPPSRYRTYGLLPEPCPALARDGAKKRAKYAVADAASALGAGYRAVAGWPNANTPRDAPATMTEPEGSATTARASSMPPVEPNTSLESHAPVRASSDATSACHSYELGVDCTVRVPATSVTVTRPAAAPASASEVAVLDGCATAWHLPVNSVTHSTVAGDARDSEAINATGLAAAVWPHSTTERCVATMDDSKCPPIDGEAYDRIHKKLPEDAHTDATNIDEAPDAGAASSASSPSCKRPPE